MLRRLLSSLLLTALVGLGGCATTGGGSNDPLEGYNRAMFGFNDALDKVIFKPVASGYKTVMPDLARTGVTNFFANLGDIWIGINNVLQGKVGAGAGDLGRFALNSTVGILGLIDVASSVGLEKHNEDFGQTLGRWGIGSGAYVVLPFFGPSNLRDGFSRLVVDWHGDPLWYVYNIPTRNQLIGVRIVENRADLLDVGRLAEEAALDHYAYVRDAYTQRRRSLIYDGDPPSERNPAKSSDLGEEAEPVVRAADVVPPQSQSRIVNQWGEKVITAADEDLTPAKEFAQSQAQPVAARREAVGVSVAVYEPKVPDNHEALLAISSGLRLAPGIESLKP